MAKKRQKGGGSRKIDRNRDWCKAYKARGQREKNKALRQERHLRNQAKKKERAQARS